MRNHIADIKAGTVTKTNVIGIRKALNADARRVNHPSMRSCTDPKISHKALGAIIDALATRKPIVTGELHESGLKLLRSKRYAKRLAPVADIIADLESFRLIGFDDHGSHGQRYAPIYRATGAGKYFDFWNIPWQSGGDGPEILEGPRSH